jgi:Cu+-exporting ATPase
VNERTDQASGSTATDPVCGMRVDPSSTQHRVEHESESYVFCSAHCLEKFKVEPTLYLDSSDLCDHHDHVHDRAGSDAPPESGAGPYICPMCPGVSSPQPAACPKCGMALEPATPAARTRVQYTCPMHPEIVRDEPGTCPICGMGAHDGLAGGGV